MTHEPATLNGHPGVGCVVIRTSGVHYEYYGEFFPNESTVALLLAGAGDVEYDEIVQTPSGNFRKKLNLMLGRSGGIIGTGAAMLLHGSVQN